MRFQSTPRDGSGHPAGAHLVQRFGVSIHAPATGAALVQGESRGAADVSIHPPRGERQDQFSVSVSPERFQSTPRAGSGWVGMHDNHATPVSIHAPARGAAGRWGSPRRQQGVSIHAPARGAAQHLVDLHMIRARPGVSIHAPARGASWSPAWAIPARNGFNPRPARGAATATTCCIWCRTRRFNPRPRAGGDPGGSGAPSPGRGRFNPRPRAGGDQPGGAPRGVGVDVSIHAPARGATCRWWWPCTSSGRFNPRPRGGGDNGAGGDGLRPLRFNPRPRAGGDSRRGLDHDAGRSGVSIHAPAQGATAVAAEWR